MAIEPVHTNRRSRLGRVVVVAGVLALGWAVWSGWVRDNVIPRNFGVVEDALVYRSGRLTPAALARVQRRHGIKTIVDLGAFDNDPAGEQIEQRTAAALGIERFVFPLEGDGTGNPNAYVQALRVMADPDKQPVLVHCATGAQRTGAAALLYGRIVRGQSDEELNAELCRFGHDPERNRRMAPYLSEWSEPVKRAFRTGAPIEGHPSLSPGSDLEAGKTVVIPVRNGRPASSPPAPPADADSSTPSPSDK